MDDILKDHLWNYFTLHSQQRMTIFNYYIVISGGIIAAIGFCLQSNKDYSLISSMLSFMLILVSFLFYKIDQRTSCLIKISELGLKHFEVRFNDNEYKVFRESEDLLATSSNLKSPLSIMTYGQIFRISYMVIGLWGFVLLFLIVSNFFK